MEESFILPTGSRCCSTKRGGSHLGSCVKLAMGTLSRQIEQLILPYLAPSPFSVYEALDEKLRVSILGHVPTPY